MIKKIVLAIIGILFLAVVGLGGFAYYKLNTTITKIQTSSDKTQTSDTATNAGKPVAYLLLGTDTGELGRDYKGRTDSMMVAIANPKTKQSYLISIPRDTAIDYNGTTIKINAAYAYGSADSAVSAVENLLNIKLNGYALVNMGGVEKLVDAVGGVTVTSPLTFTYEGASFVEGQSYDLDGATALKFSRMRYDDPRGDYGRQERQRLILAAIAKKATNVNSLFNTELMNSLSENVLTDISVNSMKNLALKYRTTFGNMKSDHLQGTTQTINNSSMEVMDSTEIQRVHDEITAAMAE